MVNGNEEAMIQERYDSKCCHYGVLLAHLILFKNEYYLKCGWSVHFNTLDIHI